MNQRSDIKLVEEALKEAAWKARYGTREERAGKFLGKQVAVEKAVAVLQKKSGD
ncbi:hypothetical protein [Caulobacter radicis]|uniref:hypothetical protein n=1 Tax=Caulobacter radicis TaxID=2172650 RepID=UPI0014034651|nr:hypothetical protein [Caulobacter radicis]